MSARPTDWKSSRWKLWRSEGIDLALPEISGVDYLLDMMMAEGLGWCSFDQMGGATAVTWSEINSFSTGAGLELEPWEARQLRAMSVAYVNGMERGREPMTVSPAYADNPDTDPGVALERKRVNDSLKAGMSAMARQRQPGSG